MSQLLLALTTILFTSYSVNPYMKALAATDTLESTNAPINKEKWNRETWTEWKKEQFKNHLESPVSYLNAIQVKSASPGEKLFLNESTSIETTQWSKERPKKVWATVHFPNTGPLKALLQIKGSPKPFEVLPGTARQDNQWKLPNGSIITLQVGKTSQKLWAYVFDPSQIKKFTGFRFFPYNSKAIIKAQVSFFDERKKISHVTYQNIPTHIWRVGTVQFEFDNKKHQLSAFSWQKPDQKLKYIALIFSDGTAPKWTYGGGRELIVRLNTAKPLPSSVTLDFNRTINFYCAHSPYWHCPVGIQEELKTSLFAGEMLPKEKLVKK